MPAPITPNSSPSNTALSGGGWLSGLGHTQTSGTSSAYAQYAQWLEIVYTRNPINTLAQVAAPYRSLSQLSALDFKDVVGTQLHFHITAHNSCTILSGNFSLSGSYQGQKFTVLPQKFDKHGYSYGDVSGASGLNSYVFGPQGRIITHQPYVRRHAATSADVPYSFTQIGTTHALLLSGPPTTSSVFGNGGNIGQDYDYYVTLQKDIHTGTDWPDARKVTGQTFDMFGGGYATSSEPGWLNNNSGAQNLISFLETNAGLLGASGWNERFSVFQPLSSNGSSNSMVVEADRLPRNPYYNTNWHDYN